MNAIRSVDQRVKSGFVQVAPTIERKTGSLSVRKICIEIELFWNVRICIGHYTGKKE